MPAISFSARVWKTNASLMIALDRGRGFIARLQFGGAGARQGSDNGVQQGRRMFETDGQAPSRWDHAAVG